MPVAGERVGSHQVVFPLRSLTYLRGVPDLDSSAGDERGPCHLAAWPTGATW
jgi:hypothetical protein